ncbi:MAG: hypothetical protein WC588_01720 [Candidatus Micrarchaeia archaeon]
MVGEEIAASIGSLFAGGEAVFGRFGATVAFLSIGIAVYGIVVGTFYTHLSKRLLYDIKPDKRHMDSFLNRLGRMLLFLFKYTLLFPSITFAWFVFLAGSIFILSRTASLETVFVLSISLVAAIRILAYYDEKIAEDLAKLLPVSLLTVVIVDSTLFTQELVQTRALALSGAVPEFASLILFVVLLEWTLRIIYVIMKFILQKMHQEEPESIWKDEG